jgi:sporulation protein YlmC with PRC-barrel domain
MMLKKLMLTTAVSALMIGGAMAQTTPSPAPAPSASAQSGTTGSVTQQKPDQYLASKFRGTDVVGADNQKIGDVTDILFDKNGKIEAYIVSVGGFLGIGAKDVAVEPSKFQVMAAEGATSYERLKLSMTKDQLQQMASFEPYSPPAPARTTTGAGGLGGPGGGATRPATGTGN